MSEETLTVSERHELECLRNHVAQADYPCSPHCAGYLREMALRNGLEALQSALSQQLNQPDGICPNCSKPLGSDEVYHAGYDWDNYRTIPATIGRGKYCDHIKRRPDENEMASTPGGIR